jgi:type IV secretion system protein VirB3
VKAASTPLHVSLVRPVLLGGAERELVLVNTMTVFALVMGLGPHPASLGLAAVLATAGHSALVLAARFDPQMFRVYTRHVRFQAFYPARALVHAPLPVIHRFQESAL